MHKLLRLYLSHETIQNMHHCEIKICIHCEIKIFNVFLKTKIKFTSKFLIIKSCRRQEIRYKLIHNKIFSHSKSANSFQKYLVYITFIRNNKKKR